MRKFTAFTILLTVIVIVVLAEMFVNDYLPNINGFVSGDEDGEQISFEIPESLKASVLGTEEQNKLGADVEKSTEISDVDAPETGDVLKGSAENSSKNPFQNSEFMDLSQLPDEYLPIVEETEDSIFDFGNSEDAADNIAGLTATQKIESLSSSNSSDSSVPDFEDSSYVSANSAYLREEQIRSAGFVAAHLEEEDHYNSLFKTISIEDLYDTTVSKMVIKTDSALMAKIYIFKVGIRADVGEVYQLLKLRSSESGGVSINETNEYGTASFYMNDPGRNSTAFLTVRVSGLIYAFSYPKEYHAQIKNLIKLLEWELG